MEVPRKRGYVGAGDEAGGSSLEQAGSQTDGAGTGPQEHEDGWRGAKALTLFGRKPVTEVNHREAPADALISPSGGHQGHSVHVALCQCDGMTRSKAPGGNRKPEVRTVRSVSQRVWQILFCLLRKLLPFQDDCSILLYGSSVLADCVTTVFHQNGSTLWCKG